MENVNKLTTAAKTLIITSVQLAVLLQSQSHGRVDGGGGAQRITASLNCIAA